MLKNKSILITGGAGSSGKKFIVGFLKNIDRAVGVYSRDEWKQFEMRKAIINL
jgi:UDP-N-acetylglucosamine 4,6-dehydratase